MYLKNKIIMAFFCVLAVGIGFFSLTVNATTAANLGGSQASLRLMSTEQLQQIILNLQQQIIQLTQLLNQKNKTNCGNNKCDAGETAANCVKDCATVIPICQRTLSGSPTSAENEECARANGTILCGNGWCSCSCPTVTQKSCSQLCEEKGYDASRCAAWAVGTLKKNTETVGCNKNETSLGDSAASDCNTMNLVGGGRDCCCSKALNCLSEGQIGPGGPLPRDYAKPTKCCAGLKSLIMQNVSDGGFLCTAKCGNNDCDANEDKFCPQDCKTACPIASTPACYPGIIITAKDANGCAYYKCSECPLAAAPYCPNGAITTEKDNNGCSVPKCVKS